MTIRIKQQLKSWLHLAYGASTFLPFVPNNLAWRGTGGTDSARYCYSIWMRHLVKATSHGMVVPPHTVAEIGPGDSLGIGLAALLTGVSRYLALDVVQYADLSRSAALVDELVELIAQRVSIPDESEFPEIKPPLDSYNFPHALLSDSVLDAALDPSRVASIKKCLLGAGCAESFVKYIVPWDSKCVVGKESVDLLFSQAVMEHVDDLSKTYFSISEWLKPKGFCSHQIDFKSHDLTPCWDGYRAFSDFKWKMLRGKRPYLINREPCSTHSKLLVANGLELLETIQFSKPPETSRKQLALRFAGLSEADREISGVFFVARKQI
jgi:hypothetical protein